ncbi:unnamed protein product [Auanema sp. JU1783]|nr:unnamed protein product [Auanema sp. JU1783]
MSNDWGNGWGDTQWNNNQYNQQSTGYTNNGWNDDFYQSQQQQPQQPQQSQQPAQNPYGQTQAYGNFQQPAPAPQNNMGGNSFGFPGQQFMSDPMLAAAQQFGGQFAEQQKEKLTKYITGFNLKYYFSVDNTYVGKKLAILLFPFLHREWAPRHCGGDGPVPAKEDVNAPDLYIPIMAFITYVLVSGFVLGTQGRFSPEMLGILTSNAFIWVILENIVVFVSKYILNISQSLTLWHSLSFSTYKFVGMIACLIVFMTGGKTLYYCTLGYTAFALVFFLLQTVKNFIFDSNHFGGDDGRKRKLILILFIAISQPFIMWWLTSSQISPVRAKPMWRN